MKITFIITGLNTGGAEMMLLKVLSGLDRTRFQSSVISLSDKGTLGARMESLGIPVRTLGMPAGMPRPRYIASLTRMVLREKPDIIQSWMSHANILATVSSLILLNRYPVIWNIRQSLHSMDYEKKSFTMIIRAGRCLSRFPKRIVYNSRTGAEQHEHIGYQAAKRVLIPNGFDTNVFRPSAQDYMSLRRELSIPDDSLIVGLIGRYHPMKDHANFIQAASLLHEVYPSVHFVLAGFGVDGSNTALLRQIAGSNLSRNVHLLGERNDMPAITAALDIASSTSVAEGFPNTIGEAMSCGVPCVVTGVGDSAWIVDDTGRVVQPGDPEALAKAWSELIEMGAEGRRGLGLKARQRVIENFSLETVVKQYEQLYQEIYSFSIRSKNK